MIPKLKSLKDKIYGSVEAVKPAKVKKVVKKIIKKKK